MVTEPFILKEKKPIVGFNMASMLNKKPTKGDIGIEIEVEGNKFQKTSVPSPWSYHQDGSLRGHDNAEYVLKAPIEFKRVPEAIQILWNMFEAYGSKLDASNRTSVHIHLNAQKFHLDRLTNFLAMYFSIEEILTQWCGDHRVGNLFCLRAKDATAIVSEIKKFIQYDGCHDLREGLHYAGLNANALYKFGSLEIRTLRGCTNPQTIIDWVAILERIYKISADFPDPRDLPVKFSSEGPLSYLEMILGDKTQMVLEDIGYSNERTRNALYEGIRLAQDLCYCRDWSLYKAMDVKDDPFGRSTRKVANTLLNMQPTTPQQEYNQAVAHLTQTQPNWHNPFLATPPLTIAIPTTMTPAMPGGWGQPDPLEGMLDELEAMSEAEDQEEPQTFINEDDEDEAYDEI